MPLPPVPAPDQRKNRATRDAERRRRRLIWLVATAAVVVGLLLVKPVFHWFKASRATQLAESGSSLAGAGKLNEAADKFRAALQLDPLNYFALQGAAQLASRVQRPEALDLWEQVVKNARATTADRQGYAEQLLLSGRPRNAAAVIDQLLKESPDKKTLELASRYARSTGDDGKAIEFARLAQKAAPNDVLVRFHLAEVLAGSGNAAERAEARKILWDLSDKPSPSRQAAIEALAVAPELSDSERQRVIDLLSTLAPHSLPDALLTADLQLQRHPDEVASVYNQVISRWNGSELSDRVELLRWLNLHQQPERVLSLVRVEDSLTNNQLLLVRLDALAALQRWNDINTVLARTDLTLDPSVIESFKARAAQEQNDTLDAELHWNHAVSLASGDPLKLRFVANFAEQSRAPAVALKAYDQLAKFPAHAAFAYRGTEHLSVHGGDLAVQRAAAEKMTDVARDDPNAAAQLAYLNLLSGIGIEENTATAKRLVKEHPDRLSFRVTAALGLLRQHDPGQAMAQFKGPAGAPPIDWSKTPPAWRVVYAAVLMANDQTAPAQQIIRNIPLDRLAPEERALIEAK